MKENEILKDIVETKKTNTNPVKSPPRDPFVRTVGLPAIVPNPHGSTSTLEKADYRLVTAIQAAHRSFCITNPALPDNPIVFASKGFLDLTGYRLDQVLGRNCRFLQGPKTDPRQVDIIRKGVALGVDTTVCILNYKCDGTPFYCQLYLAALRDINHKIVNFVGVQVELEVRTIGNTRSWWLYFPAVCEIIFIWNMYLRLIYICNVAPRAHRES